MSVTVLIAVLSAALLHASWNAIVRGGGDKAASMAAVVLGQGLCGALLIPFAPTFDWSIVWPFMIATILLHLGYQLFLMLSYSIADLNQVYPIARGSAPLMVTLFSVVVLGVSLSGVQLGAIALIIAGIFSLVLANRSALADRRGPVFALITGVFIAAYSIVDGLGAREAGTALGFYSWGAFGNGVVLAAWLLLTRPRTLQRAITGTLPAFIIGGAASFVAYALVTWAFTQAPIALVSALRETSIIFALLIGVVFLKERITLPKVAAAIATLAGVILLRLAA